MSNDTRQWLVTEERRSDIDYDTCGECEHARSDHIDDLVDGEPVGCVVMECWYDEAHGRHKFVEVPRITDRWVVIKRQRYDALVMM